MKRSTNRDADDGSASVLLLALPEPRDPTGLALASAHYRIDDGAGHLAPDDVTLDNRGLRQHPRLDNDPLGAGLAVPILGHLDQPEPERETRLIAQILADAARSLGDAVADDQQQEPPGGKIARHPVDEAGFVHVAAGGTRQFEQGVAMPLRRDRDLPLQVVIGVAAQLAGIVEDLTDHLAPGLRVTPELALDHHQPAAFVGEQHVNEPDAGDVELLGYRKQSSEARVQLVHRQDGRVVVDEIAQRVLAAGVALRDAR